jgi:hypothetical protein
MEWLSSMGVAHQFSKEDIESGRTVGNILKAINRESKLEIQDGNSAMARVSNWNTITYACLLPREYLKLVGIKLTQD